MPRPDPVALRALLGPGAAPCRRALSGEHGVALPGLVDHHVHLHLIDARALPAGGIAGVVDLGGDPTALARLPRDGMPRYAYAGAFLTAAGGYPSDRPWAPASVVREVTDPSRHPGVAGGAGTAVDEQVEFGASVIKVALNATAGPVLDVATLAAVVECAHSRGVPVVAHAEGDGMTRRALDAGVDALAHTPFTERLPADLIGQAVASGQRWISTLDIHRGDADALMYACANLTDFVSGGGAVLYGTDLGNGDLPEGVNAREIAGLHDAGVQGATLLAALTDPWPLPRTSEGVATFVPGDAPGTLAEIAAWLSQAIVVPAEELIHDEH
jgi:hypothetical protein